MLEPWKKGSFSMPLSEGKAKPVCRIAPSFSRLVRNSTSAAAAFGYLLCAAAPQPAKPNIVVLAPVLPSGSGTAS